MGYHCRECGVLTTQYIEVPSLGKGMYLIPLCPEHKVEILKRMEEEKIAEAKRSIEFKKKLDKRIKKLRETDISRNSTKR